MKFFLLKMYVIDSNIALYNYHSLNSLVDN